MTTAAVTSSILVRDGIAYLSITDGELMDAIVDATSFTLEGMEFRIKSNRADKRTKLVRNQKAPVGLLDRICRTMVLHGVEPQVSYADSQMAPKPKTRMWIYDVEPRPYQQEAALAAQLNDRGIFRVPTGGGKTLLAAMVIASKGHSAVVLVPTIDLLHQTKAYFARHLHGHLGRQQWKIGQLGDGMVDPRPVTIATVRTMAKALDVAYESYEYAEYDDTDDTQVDKRKLRNWVQDLGTVIVDEAHILGAATVFDVTTKIPALAKFGFSASPWRDDGADLMIEAATGPPIYHITAQRLVEMGYLLAPEFHVIDTSAWWHAAAWGQVCDRCGRQRRTYTLPCPCGANKWKSQYNEAYREEIVKNDVRNAMIAARVIRLARPTLVLVKQISHGRKLAEFIPGSVFLSGKDRGADRKAVFEATRKGQQLVLVCTTIADQGLDIPQLGALVCAAGGKSSTRHLQRIGRVVRPLENKERPVVIDFDDSHIHSWFHRHEQLRRKIEHAEWDGTGAEWVYE